MAVVQGFTLLTSLLQSSENVDCKCLLYGSRAGIHLAYQSTTE